VNAAGDEEEHRLKVRDGVGRLDSPERRKWAACCFAIPGRNNARLRKIPIKPGCERCDRLDR